LAEDFFHPQLVKKIKRKDVIRTEGKARYALESDCMVEKKWPTKAKMKKEE